MEFNESKESLRQSIELARQEVLELDCQDKKDSILRWMREGIAVYLDEKGNDAPEIIRITPSLVFRTSNASFEITRQHAIQEPPGPTGWGGMRYKTTTLPVEGMPAMENVWMENVMTLLSVI